MARDMNDKESWTHDSASVRKVVSEDGSEKNAFDSRDLRGGLRRPKESRSEEAEMEFDGVGIA